MNGQQSISLQTKLYSNDLVGQKVRSYDVDSALSNSG